MAITVNIYYTGKNGAARKFADEMIASGTIQKIKEEAGNIRYDYFVKLDDPETVLLIDSWESQAALDIHHASPMMNKIIELRDKYELYMKVERYVTDASGIPSKDIQYIRRNGQTDSGVDSE